MVPHLLVSPSDCGSHSLASAPSPRGAELTAGRSPAHPRVFSLENSDVSSDDELRRRDPPLLGCLFSSVPQVALSCKRFCRRWRVVFFTCVMF